VSLLTGRPVRADLAMTGENQSVGSAVLPVGGIKEKRWPRTPGTRLRTGVLPRRRRTVEDVPAVAAAEHDSSTLAGHAR